MKKYIGESLDRMLFCFKHIKKKYFFVNEMPYFDHLNSDHYAMFLYFFSNTVFQRGGSENLAKKIFLLNKALHGLDAFYKVTLPDIFIFVHPLGTVIGNAKFKNYFAIYQNCIIGANEQGEYPEFDEGIVMYSSSSIIGKCKIGKNVVFGANAFIINSDVKDGQIVVGAYPDHQSKPCQRSVKERIFER